MTADTMALSVFSYVDENLSDWCPLTCWLKGANREFGTTGSGIAGTSPVRPAESSRTEKRLSSRNGRVCTTRGKVFVDTEISSIGRRSCKASVFLSKGSNTYSKAKKT